MLPRSMVVVLAMATAAISAPAAQATGCPPASVAGRVIGTIGAGDGDGSVPLERCP